MYSQGGIQHAIALPISPAAMAAVASFSSTATALLLLFLTATSIIPSSSSPSSSFSSPCSSHGGGARRDCDLSRGGGIQGDESDESVEREFFSFEGDVAWVVQVSDLHISAHHPERGEELRSLLTPALRAIRPSLVLITGDITDAKNKERTSSKQDETEWIKYRNIINAIVDESGISKRRFIDIRGNHDKYGVPCVGNKLDFFSTYSISSQLNRFSSVQSISLVAKDWRYIFLVIDDTMNRGIRGPSNLFGHPTDKRVELVEYELQYWDNDPNALVTKVVFGHYPMSFTASSETGKHYEVIFAKQSVSAYLCGHLHAKLGKQLWRKHSIDVSSEFKQQKELKQFWEWELGDWKESRLIRILAIDRGRVSFSDIELPNKPGGEEDFGTAILITSPIDSRSMNTIELKNQMPENDIHVLVFSLIPIINVTAKIFDSFNSFSLVEEVPLRLANSSTTHKSLFQSAWNVENYKTASSSQYLIQVFVIDAQGKETASPQRPFSVNGKPATVKVAWLSYLVFHIRWENLYSVLLWSNICFLVVLLLLPKLLNHFIKRNSLYRRWASSVSISLPVQEKKILFKMLWFLIEGSRNWVFWCSMLFYLLYLLWLPWFWGHAVSEKGEIAKMFLFGWIIYTSDCSIKRAVVGNPDIMTITIPFMYLVVTPLFLLIYSLLAERSASFLLNNSKSNCSKESKCTKLKYEKMCQPIGGESGDLYEITKGLPSLEQKIYKVQTRTCILFACLILLFVHFKQISMLMGAYGVLPVAFSPAICWIPPLLVAAAVYSTRSTSKSKVLI